MQCFQPESVLGGLPAAGPFGIVAAGGLLLDADEGASGQRTDVAEGREAGECFGTSDLD